MSRCFPFPPPGYEKKARVNDTDLLIKEKHKEKKHRKDKNEKEKRDDKEKKDKHRSKEKHKDEKERKEKHRDKDQRNIEKNQTSNKKRIEKQPGVSNILQSNEVPNSHYVQELAGRIMDEDVASGSQMLPKITANEHRKTELHGTAVGRSVDPQSSQKERSQFVQMVVATDHRRGELSGAAMLSSSGHQFSDREKVKDKNKDSKKFNGQRNHVDPGGLEKACNLSRPEEELVHGICKMEEKEAERKEKSKHKEGNGKGDKPKDGGRENKTLKDKDRGKDKKLEEKAKDMKEINHEPPKIKVNAPKLKERSQDPLDFRIITQSVSSELSNITPAGMEILGKLKEPEMATLGKRKETEKNGFILDNGIHPHKLSKSFTSSNTILQNGRKPEARIRPLHEKLGPSDNNKVDIKQQKINGLTSTHHLPVSSTKPLSSKVPPPNENGERSAKPPHPDTNYLMQVLSVPKMEELPDSLDQEWLFSSRHKDVKNVKMGSPGIDGTRQVWAEALQIESADIAALPYVLPY